MTTEAENINKLQKFFKEEYNNVRAYVRSRIIDATDRDAEDIIQDVALKIFSKDTYSSPIDNIAGYVYFSIRNKIVDVFRKKKNQKIYQDNENEYFNVLISDFSELIFGKADNEYSEYMKNKLMEAISELKPAYRDIIIAIEFEGYTFKELSDETNTPIGTLLSRRHRALSILTSKLEKLKK